MIKNNMFAWYEKFLAINFWSPRTTLDISNPSSLVSKWKLFSIVVIRLLCWVFIIRALIAITLPSDMTKNMICEYFQFYGNPTTIHIGLLSGAVCANFVANPFQYALYNSKSQIFEALNKIKNKSVEYKLDKRSERKFKIRLQVISLFSLQFIPTFMLISVYFTVGLIVVYMKQDYNLIGKYNRE